MGRDADEHAQIEAFVNDGLTYVEDFYIPPGHGAAESGEKPWPVVAGDLDAKNFVLHVSLRC